MLGSRPERGEPGAWHAGSPLRPSGGRRQVSARVYLIEEPFQVPDSSKPDETDNVPQSRYYDGTVGGTVRERYMQSELSVHTHVRIQRRGEPEPRDLCAVFKRAEENLVAELAGDASRQAVCRIGKDRTSEMKHLMLVDVRQLLENPERMSFDVLASVVRLQSLDDCLSVWLDAPNLLQAAATGRLAAGNTRVNARVTEYGELRSRKAVSSVADTELPSEVIERRPDVMHTLAYRDPPLVGRLFADTCAEDLPFFVELGLDSVRVTREEARDILIEGFQMLLRPGEL